MCSAEDVVVLPEATFFSAAAAAEDRGIITTDNCLLFDDWNSSSVGRGKLPRTQREDGLSLESKSILPSLH